MGLLKDKRVSQNKLPADGRIKYVYNDYHRRITNPGYSSRNLNGNPFHWLIGFLNYFNSSFFEI